MILINREYLSKCTDFPEERKSPLEFLATTTVYPTFTQNNCPEWKMYVKFAIMADGSIDHVNVVRGFYPSCAVRSVRVNFSCCPR